ncbi:MAG: beta-galactosidase [Firmicutes bacterium HGW-Firmicutes-1]|jgi:beta-galactosidase|nr:MAG: beta-galactosidase [Firmicutes bacterium HGW-Firmicutes-1]
MSRVIKPFNMEWQFIPSFDIKYTEKEYLPDNFQIVSLPHTNQEIPYNYFDEKIYQFVSCYRKCFTITETNKDQSIYVDFEGVMTYAQVYINGIYLGEHKGGYTPFSFELTPHINYTEENILVVMVDSTERDDIPPFGFVIDYLTYGGIYREVNLRFVHPVHIENVFARTNQVLSPKKKVEATIIIQNNNMIPTSLTITAQLRSQEGSAIANTQKEITINSLQENHVLNFIDLENIKLWDIDTPVLYILKITLLQNGHLIDAFETKIGFRTATFTPNGFFLNGQPLKIRGLNRHQAFPYVGYAMPKRAQIKDADILKYELSLNTVRTSHYPQSKHFLDRCDEIGLLVFEEIPGWQHIGDENWKKVACENVREMIVRDFNHPSIIIWGVRINESSDDHDFFLETNKIAHELDDTRPTGGVRCIQGSELLEDVYTMNDFTLGDPSEQRVLRPQQEVTGLDHHVPYLVTEFNGHMYPTKRYDQEERLNEHALRHLSVHNAAALDPHKSGAIGWCAFDYNTHFDFGSGDRICYHGVMDMFRIPKYAAAFYKSQVSPKKMIVMDAVTRYSRGERAIGGVAPLTIFTNCDSIQLLTEDKLIGTYCPAKDRYPGVTYPPIIIDKLDSQWGMSFGDITLVGYVNHEERIRETYIKNPLPTTLFMEADDLVLRSAEIDTTRIVFKLLDQSNHELPYTDEIVTVSLNGPALLIGPSTFSLIGGCRGAWIKTTGEVGTITIHATCCNLNANIVINVVK